MASIILMAIFSIIAYLGPLFKIEPRIQMIGGIFSTIGWVLAIVVLAATPSSAVQTRWDTVWGSGAYSEVQTIATTAGFTAAPFSWSMTLMATVWPIGLVWPYLILLYGGEVSDPAKNLVFTQLFGALILAGLLTAGAGLFQRTFTTFSSQYATANAAVGSGAATFTLNQSFTGGFGTFTALMTDNPVISGWILLSAPVIALTATPINMAWVTRGFFQASLDRVMPSFFGTLSRYHTPTMAIIYYFLFGAPFAIIIALPGMYGLVSVITSLIALWGIEMIFQSIAALQLPFLKPALYEGSIRKQPVLFGIPLISILGVVILPVSLFVLIGFTQGAAFLAMVSMAVQYGFSALWFLTYALYLRKKNIDIGTIYESLPPE
jgi:amino acid transporter